MRGLAVTALVVALVSGCTCRLSGTPLDTMEKRLNPACWCEDDATEPGDT